PRSDDQPEQPQAAAGEGRRRGGDVQLRGRQGHDEADEDRPALKGGSTGQSPVNGAEGVARFSGLGLFGPSFRAGRPFHSQREKSGWLRDCSFTTSTLRSTTRRQPTARSLSTPAGSICPATRASSSSRAAFWRKS